MILPARWEISSRLMPAWPIDTDHILELEAVERTPDNRIRWKYRLSRKSQLIFSRSDIRSGVGAILTTRELVRAAQTVLTHLTLKPGDTDSDVFSEYTQRQLRWRDRWAEELSIYALDGCGYCGSERHPSPGCDVR